ncbi:glycosyltransferase [uncultured Clostridium sp.]|uniref:glycosyltransferase n=1 Tax=uncultured Clostridium sp. TaxID=59620 RepID=UPI0026715676|nr:glycosyltransferase [uncultured Clostridium sp.]
MEKVCVLCVTYNRKDYLLKMISALEKQVYKIDSIIIVDNYSNDGTNEILKEKSYIIQEEYDKISLNIKNQINFYYYRSSVNMGGAGGFKKCFEIANTLNVDYYWVMDDDVLPDENCLKNLIKYQTENNQITIPNRNDENFKDRIVIDINMKSIFKGVKSRKEYYEFENNVTENINVVDMPFEGPLIRANLAKIIGLPNDKYFIYYDDTDYAWRAKKHTNITYVKNAILHKQIIPTNSIRNQINWKEYYLLRNTIFFDRKYGENFGVRNLRPLLIWISLSIKNINNIKNLVKLNKAIWDGYFGKMGRTVEPGEF